MANIVRCELPDGVHRFKPFTVADHRDFILVRNDMTTKSEEEQKLIIDELMEDYFYEYPKAFRPYIFLKVYLSSIGKTKIPVVMTCSKCKKDKRYLFNLKQAPLKNPEVEVSGLKLKFSFPDEIIEDTAKMIVENIMSVEDSNGVYEWNTLDDNNKLLVIDAITIDVFESIISQMKTIDFELKTRCCDDTKIIKYDNIYDIFKLLIHPDEVYIFYQINHRLITQGKYDLGSVMSMLPVERGIALSLVEKDLK
ncbi:baseplate protein [Klebsiella phage Metamorpho]|nr:baseplate protein [Klebsiella phage Metamorpho]